MEDASLRNSLAVERTRLANERTFLAYVRTALAMAAGGAALFQFFPALTSIHIAAWVLFAVGATTLLFGTYRFLAVRSELK